MIVLDANYIMRYLLDDQHEMFMDAKKIIDTEKCLILNEVIAEVVYVLQGMYKVPRSGIAETLTDLLMMENLMMFEDKRFLVDALEIFRDTGLDFVDCYLCSIGSHYKVKTFDKKLLKCLVGRNLREL